MIRPKEEISQLLEQASSATHHRFLKLMIYLIARFSLCSVIARLIWKCGGLNYWGCGGDILTAVSTQNTPPVESANVGYGRPGDEMKLQVIRSSQLFGARKSGAGFLALTIVTLKCSPMGTKLVLFVDH
jgi:hypothetical protein